MAGELVVSFVIVLTIIFLVYWRWSRRRLMRMASELGSGVLALPLVGHAYLFLGGGEARMKAFQILGRDALRKGGTTSYWLGTALFAMVADPVVAEVVLKTCLEKDDVTELTKTFIGNGSIFAPVSIWRRRRKVLLPNFGTKNLKHFVSIFAKQSGVMVEQLRASTGAGPITMWKYFTAYTIDSIAEATLGFDMNAQTTSDQPMLKAFGDGFAICAERICKPWLHNDVIYSMMPVYKKLIDYRDYLWCVFDEFIQTKRKQLKEIDHRNPADTDGRMKMNLVEGIPSGAPVLDKPRDVLKTFLELLLEGRESVTDVEVREETMVIMMAGNDTSAVGAAFVTLMLSRHPEVQEKVYEELYEVFGESTRAATMADLPRLRYLDAVVRETMRLYPPVPLIARKVEKDIILPSGVTLVPGSGVMVNIWALHRNPQYWGGDAEMFRPERFLDADKHLAFMPFSHGPRNCLGYQFAMMSMKTALSSLLRHYKVLPATKPSSLQSGFPPLRLKFELMMKDVDDFQVQIVSRNSVYK